METAERLRRSARDLETQIRALHLHTHASRRPVLPGRAPSVEVDTRHIWHAFERLQRALSAFITETRRTEMGKPLTFGTVDRTPEEASKNGTVSFEHLRRFGVLRKHYKDAGCMEPTWTAIIDCEINGAWYAPGEEVPW